MIVSVLSPKGGCGKSTATLTLASVFAKNEDLSIAVVDADPRQSIARVWLGKRNEEKLGEPPFKVISDPSDSSILDTLDAAGDDHDLVFVDLEGVAGLMASYAASASDLCIVPMRPSALDGDAAGAALKMIRDAGRAARRTVPARILITQTRLIGPALGVANDGPVLWHQPLPPRQAASIRPRMSIYKSTLFIY